MLKELILDLLEYALILAFIWLFATGKISPNDGKALIVYVAVGLFFLVSGGAWLMRDVEALKEYEKYRVWMEALAFLIGVVTLLYLLMW